MTDYRAYRREQQRYAARRNRGRQGNAMFVAQIILGMASIGTISWMAAPRVQSAWFANTAPAENVQQVERSVYYPGCDEARAAGVAPIYRGSPGYREGIDGDGDGIACEPYL
ncbi:excalibur calcium-binding domain-containing protein [Sphingomonas sp. 4RDLI-65]|uniref:excalibur calcium-binding domain-containing protein n=1 Tax=Sphingomonas sp. 4RDLI-65 TaxID=3111641 RepID=UPI003C2419E9